MSLTAWILCAHAAILPFFALSAFGPNSTGTFTFDGDVYLISEHGVFFALLLGGYWLLAVTVAFGFFRRVSWSRYLVVGPLIAQCIIGIFAYGLHGGAVVAIAMVGGITWYFFGKENVTEYFEGPQ